MKLGEGGSSAPSGDPSTTELEKLGSNLFNNMQHLKLGFIVGRSLALDL